MLIRARVLKAVRISRCLFSLRARANVCPGDLAGQEVGRGFSADYRRNDCLSTRYHHAALLSLRAGRDSGSAAAEHTFSRCFPWTGIPGAPAGAKPSNIQVPWHKKRTSGALPHTLFGEVALGSGCPLHPCGLVNARLVRSTPQPHRSWNFVKAPQF